MTDDVRLFTGAHPPIIGKDAVAKYYTDEEKTRLKMFMETSRIAAERALTHGRFLFTDEFTLRRERWLRLSEPTFAI